MKNVLVTGGLGYIGSHVAVELINSGYNPVIVDNLYNSQPEVLDGIEEITGSKPTFYKGEFSDLQLLDKINREYPLGSIIHIAAYKAVGESVDKPLLYYENNVSGFVRLLQFVTDNKISNFVFSSSAAVYGNPPEDAVTEETACSPESPYGWSKYIDEVVLRDLCNSGTNINGVALRYFNVVGSHGTYKIGERSRLKPQNLLPLIVRAAAGQIPPITVFGDDYPTPDGTCLRDYVHVSDLARAHVAAMKQLFDSENKGYEVYNIGTGRPTSVLELIKTFEDVNDVKVPCNIGERRPGDPAAYYANVDKAEKELNWKAQETIEDACQSAWKWHLKING